MAKCPYCGKEVPIGSQCPHDEVKEPKKPKSKKEDK